MATLKPNETQWFKSQRRRADHAYNLGTQQNKYERLQSERQSNWQREDLARQWHRGRESFANSFNKRGVINSGIYQNALLRRQQDQNKAFQRNSESKLWKGQGYDLAKRQLGDVRTAAKKDLDEQETAYRRTISSVIDLYGG